MFCGFAYWDSIVLLSILIFFHTFSWKCKIFLILETVEPFLVRMTFLCMCLDHRYLCFYFSISNFWQFFQSGWKLFLSYSMEYCHFSLIFDFSYLFVVGETNFMCLAHWNFTRAFILFSTLNRFFSVFWSLGCLGFSLHVLTSFDFHS